MNTKPIIFQDAMVRALLEGRKTQTRRVVKPQPEHDEAGNAHGWYPMIWSPINKWSPVTAMRTKEDFKKALVAHCPYGQPGDLLWVREAFTRRRMTEVFTGQPAEKTIYRAGKRVKDGKDAPPDYDFNKWPSSWKEEELFDGEKWSPSIHMPRWASRLTLRLTDVRVERVQEIGYMDALAEGTPDGNYALDDPWIHENTVGDVKIHEFSELWDFINAPKGYGWDANPWVWVLEFEVIHKNVVQAVRDLAPEGLAP